MSPFSINMNILFKKYFNVRVLLYFYVLFNVNMNDFHILFSNYFFSTSKLKNFRLTNHKNLPL